FQRKTPKPVGQPEVDLPDPEESCFPDPVAPEPEPEMDLVGIEQPCIPEPEGNLVASPEPELDLVESEESCVSQTGKEMQIENSKEMKIQKIPGFIVTKRTEYTTMRTVKKIPLLGVSAWLETDLNIPKSEEDLMASFELDWDLFDSVELHSPGPSDPEPHPEENLDDPPEREWGVVDSVELYRTTWTNKLEIEEDMVDSEELYFLGRSESEPRPEWDPDVPDPVTSKLLKLENYIPENVFQLEDRLKRCTLRRPGHVSRVWPRIYIGDEEIATDRDELSDMCITHILNAAAPKKSLKYFLGKTSAEDKEGTVNTGNYFKRAAKFIKRALKRRKNQVLICCKQGDDHSATLVLAYLMIYYDMTLEEAIDHVITFRRIRPSRDFLEKLMLLNVELVEQRKLKLQDLKA
ncbi:hypothetical protein M9458_005102, partial [Cirrhinus mrigala]